MSFGQLQQATSNVSGLHCAYYIMKGHQGKTMRDIVKDFNPCQKKRNDRLIVTKMMTLLKQRRWQYVIAFSTITTVCNEQINMKTATSVVFSLLFPLFYTVSPSP